MSGTREHVVLGELVENVGNKSKKTKLDNSTPPDPIKTTHEPTSSVISDNSSEQRKYSPCSEPKQGVTAVMAVMTMDKQNHHSSKKVPVKKLVRVLLDSGSDGDLLFHKKGTDKQFPYLTRQVPKTWCTSNGNFQTKGKGDIQLKFFQYSNSKRVSIQPDVVEYDGITLEKPLFDLILGTKTMNELGIILNFKQQMITIDEIELPMTSIDKLPKSRHKALALTNSLAKAKEPASTEEATKRVVRILDANYKKANLQEIVNSCTHLSSEEQEMLLELLTEYEPLFDGTLGAWKTTPVSFELKEGAKPYHGRAFPIPKVHKETLMKEIRRLMELGVLEWQPESEWAAPSFIQPKKNGTVRVLTDFRELNKRLVRKPFPLPKISTVLQELEGFTFATALDLNMGYYTIRLDPTASRICTIIFPWGKYSYKRLPMGVAGSPDIFQSKMSELMATLEFVRTYLDDLLCITKGNLKDHLNKLRQVFNRLQDSGLKVNANKSNFCALETEYLGYILTRDGIKPQANKVQAILALKLPTNVKELRRFLGMVQYYRDLWAKRSEMLAPLTNLVGECGQTKITRSKGTKKVPWHWDEVHQKAFETVKATIAKDVVLAYPDYGKVFEVYTDASSTQLGAVITQSNRPLAFFSRKLSETQQKYSVTEIELLAIVETLKEFKGMLWGQQLVVYTDHQNLMRDALGLSSDRVYRWRLILEEYGPEIVYIKGIDNTVADAISRLDFTPAPTTKKKECKNWMTFTKRWCYLNHGTQNNSTEQHLESMSHVFANRSEDEEIFPLTVKEIAEQQHKDKNIHALYKDDKYEMCLIENTKVLCKDGKLVIPKSLQHQAVQWYHHYLQHPGHSRLEETLRAAMYWKSMRTTIRSYVKKCRSCQINKRRKLKYGHVPPKFVVMTPWEALCVDLIGPFTLKGKDGSQIDFMCLTMIDPASSWFEMVELPVMETITPIATSSKRGTKTHKPMLTKETYFDKTSTMISHLVNKTWFSQYPQCKHKIYDNGSEFKLHFEALCDSYGIKRKPTSVKNPQANAILERVHQVIMTMLRTTEIDMANTVTPSDIDTFLTNASWAIRSTYHTVLKASPGAAIFGRDMLFDIPYIADWKKIGDYRQRQTDLNTARENKQRADYDYKIGDKVLIRKDGIFRKTESHYDSEPWTITSVHTNGTIRVERGSKSERINIRRVTPYFEDIEN
ncbi:MAG: RNase H-like domain-containing protein [Bacteroidota bacterium]